MPRKKKQEKSDSLFFIDTSGDKKNRSKKKRKIGNVTKEEYEEEKRLTKALFGETNVLDEDDESLLSEKDKQQNETNEISENEEKEQQQEEEEEEENGEKEEEKAEEEEEEKPIWIDEDDEIELSKLSKRLGMTNAVSTKKIEKELRNKREQAYVQPTDWAKITEEDQDEIFRTNWKERKSSKLPSDQLMFKQVIDANVQKKDSAPIKSIRFHPNGQLLFTAESKTLSIFQFDGVENPKLQGVRISELPIKSAEFINRGDEVFMTGRRSFFYVYNIVKGRVDKIRGIVGREERSFEHMTTSPDSKYIALLGNDGYVFLLSALTKQYVTSLRMNGDASAATFSKDGKELFTLTKTGEIYQWDLSTKRCIQCFQDEGSIGGSSITLSRDGSYLATGSTSGVVNVYHRDSLSQSKPTPMKELLNITTNANYLRFNNDSQILAMSSSKSDNCCKLVHLPSLQVFPNFPGKEKLGVVTTMDFSPNNGFLSIGNRSGRALLYQLQHYSQA